MGHPFRRGWQLLARRCRPGHLGGSEPHREGRQLRLEPSRRRASLSDAHRPAAGGREVHRSHLRVCPQSRASASPAASCIAATRLPKLKGAYLCGDWGFGRIWALWLDKATKNAGAQRDASSSAHSIRRIPRDAGLLENHRHLRRRCRRTARARLGAGRSIRLETAQKQVE